MTSPDDYLEEIGVGPWSGDHPTNARYDPELLEQGDRRNVRDEYRYWTRDAIIADLDTKRFPYSVAIENRQHDFNSPQGTVVDGLSALERRVLLPSR